MIAALIERTRSIVPKRGDKALAELAKIESRRKELVAVLNAEKAEAQKQLSESPIDVESRLMAHSVWCAASIDPGGEVMRRLKAEFPDLRTPLIRAIEARLMEARSNLERTRHEEQARLNSLGDDFDADDSPVVRRVRSRAEHWEAMLSRATSRSVSEPIELIFANFTRQLLEP